MSLAINLCHFLYSLRCMNIASDFMSHALYNVPQQFKLGVSVILNSSVWSILDYFKHNVECRIITALKFKGLAQG